MILRTEKEFGTKSILRSCQNLCFVYFGCCVRSKAIFTTCGAPPSPCRAGSSTMIPQNNSVQSQVCWSGSQTKFGHHDCLESTGGFGGGGTAQNYMHVIVFEWVQRVNVNRSTGRNDSFYEGGGGGGSGCSERLVYPDTQALAASQSSSWYAVSNTRSGHSSPEHILKKRVLKTTI